MGNHDASYQSNHSKQSSLPPFISFRDAAPDDVPALAALKAERYALSVNEALPGFYREFADADHEHWKLMVALQRQEVIAFGRISWYAAATHPETTPQDEHCRAMIAPAGYYLSGLIVAPGHRRKKIGEQLTLLRLNWIAERSYEAFYVANKQNTPSIALHETLGFVELSRQFYYPPVNFHPGEGVLFRCDIGATSTMREILIRKNGEEIFDVDRRPSRRPQN